MGKKEKRNQVIPIVWKTSKPDPSIFQIPKKSTKESLIKITKPGGFDYSALSTSSSESLQTDAVSSEESPHQEGRPVSQDNVGHGEPERQPEALPDSKYPSEGALRNLPKEAEKSLTSGVSTLTLSGRGGQKWRPDVFAHSFVPEALLAINQSSATLITTPPIDGINFGQYVATFAGNQMLPALHTPPYPRLSGKPTPTSLGHLDSESYGQHFSDCLILDLEAQVPEIRSYDQFRVPLEVVDLVQQLYNLKVPGLRDGTPIVELGDTVMLRQLVIDPATRLPRGMDVWLASGGRYRNGEVAPGFTGYQVSAIVWGIDRNNETLILRAYGLENGPWFSFFNVTFVVQARTIQSLQRAVADVAQELRCKIKLDDIKVGANGDMGGAIEKRDLRASDASLSIEFNTPEKSAQRFPTLGTADDHSSRTPTQNSAGESFSSARVGNRSWLDRMLFPVEGDCVQQTALPSVAFSQTWFDISLNYEQKKAVDAVQSRNYGNLCYLINGPPGTGKTKTICEIVTQLGKDSDAPGTILLCAPSNPAADTLILRLRVQFGPKVMLRLNGFSRTFAEVPQELLPFCYVERDIFNLPPMPMLMTYKIVVTTCKDADMLVQARVTNRDLIALQRNLAKSINPYGDEGILSEKEIPLHWSALIIDEAAQATEPETLIPLTIVVPPSMRTIKCSPAFVMAGDQHQLNPRTFDRTITLHVSLFERLSNSPVFASHPLARKRLNRITQRFPMLRPPFVNLTRNYRSHPAILAVPSSLFYADTLIPEATQTESLLPWTAWRGPGWPVLFACNEGIDDCEDIRSLGGGWYNLREAEKAINYAQDLILSERVTKQSEVCIMSPFRAQVRLIRRIARDLRLYELNVGPMEAFQGLERRFVIICTTRARKRFLEDDKLRGLGVVNEKKLFNVAITRAKEGLIVIGNPWVLASDPYWSAFITFCWRNDLWQKDIEGPVSMQGFEESKVNEWTPSQGISSVQREKAVRISGLESALVFKERDKWTGSKAARRFMSGSESYEEGLWRSGMEAEELIEGMEPDDVSEYVDNELDIE